ncbi:MAG: aminoglycoside phosphotransferase family protein [Candidatus Buchananbacteria bacterium]
MKKPILLSENNIIKYLKKQVFPALNFKIKRIIFVKEILSFSNANYLFEVKVTTSQGEKKFVLKQAQPYAKRMLRQGIKKYISPNRVTGEVKMLKFLSQLWGKKYVPEILFYDRPNSIFLMSDIGSDFKLLVEEFDHGRVYPQLGKLLGELFGRLHGSTYGLKKEFNPNRAWRDYLIDSLIHQSFSSGLKKHLGDKVVNNFLVSAEKSKFCVTWVDPVFRNIFVSNNSAGFFDFDFSCSYDPAFDSGVLLAHWLWMTLKGDKKIRRDAKKFIMDYDKYYGPAFLAEKKGTAKDLKKIRERTRRWAGMYLVSRTDGVSGSYFKDYPAWEKRIRKLGINLFLNKKVAVKLKS